MRLTTNLIRKTRIAVGDKDFILGFRISGDEHTPGGVSIEDIRRIVPVLVEEGLDYIHLSSDAPTAGRWIYPDRDAAMIGDSYEIKNVSVVPVVCPNVHDPKVAEKILKEGKVDVIPSSRSLIVDTQWPNKAREGRVKDIIKCTFCNTCLGYVAGGLDVRCPLNPRAGWERFIPGYWPKLVRVRAVQGSKRPTDYL